jgi:hypothetical protein
MSLPSLRGGFLVLGPGINTFVLRIFFLDRRKKGGYYRCITGRQAIPVIESLVPYLFY